VSSLSPDHAWFIEQVRREQAGLRVFVRTLGMRSEAADDIAQEAFIVAFGKLHTFERGTNFGAWVRTIARYLVSKELRREDRRQRVLAEYVAEILAADDAPPSADIAARSEALRRCLAELPKRARDLVQRRYFEKLGPSVIASHEGRRANDIRQALFRLRADLYECIRRRLSESLA
jgi:RNA polymerase sigma-70 factor (ECF subfamily)